MSLLGLDIGTTGCKAVVFSESGTELSSCYEEYPLLVPQSDYCEIEPGVVWEAVQRVISHSAGEAGRSDPVRAVGISTLGDSVTPLDSNGDPLYNTVVGAADVRAVGQAHWIEKRMSREELFTLTGAPLHAYCTIPKVLWFREHLPEVFEQCQRFTGWQEIVHRRLGCAPAMDFSLASRTMLMDISNNTVAKLLLDLCGLDRELFYPLSHSSHVVGELDAQKAASLGLMVGAKIVTGGFDQACCALGAGVLGKGAAALSLGTLEAVTAVYDTPSLDRKLLEGNYGCNFHVWEGFYITFGYLTTAGAVLRWYRDTFGTIEMGEAARKGLDPYEVMIDSTPDRPSDLFVLPYFTGTGTPWLDPDARGAIFGLSLDTDRSQIVKGILDGICYEIRLNIERMREAGISINRLRAVGGGAKSERWMQLKADIIGIPVEVTRIREAGCLGAAVLAGKGIGVFNRIDDVEEITHVVTVFEPREAQVASYNDRFGRYMELREKVRGLGTGGRRL